MDWSIDLKKVYLDSFCGALYLVQVDKLIHYLIDSLIDLVIMVKIPNILFRGKVIAKVEWEVSMD